ncbi:MAG: hypothetical protein HQK49_07225 [Oligoflexia bacterium]|nr:hypothetical protein [Oligoflexia bacterium]
MSKSISIIFFVFILTLLSGCAGDKDEKLRNAIESARIYLIKSKCDLALGALEPVRDMKNSVYVRVLASAYACKSGYTSSVFYGTNMTKIVATQTGFLPSLTKFSTSIMTDPSDSSYLSLKEAINVLVYSGGVTIPTTAERLKVFSQQESDDINVFLLYMMLTQLGKYVFYYGNADPINGVKGAGSVGNGNPNNQTNGCFYNYNPSNDALRALITYDRANSLLGSCTATATGHSKLQPIPNANTIKRMCEGVVLFNLFVDVVGNTTMPTDAGDIGSLTDTFTSICNSTTFTGDICAVKDQTICETDYGSQPESDKLEAYFYMVYEKMFI